MMSERKRRTPAFSPQLRGQFCTTIIIVNLLHVPRPRLVFVPPSVSRADEAASRRITAPSLKRNRDYNIITAELPKVLEVVRRWRARPRGGGRARRQRQAV